MKTPDDKLDELDALAVGAQCVLGPESKWAWWPTGDMEPLPEVAFIADAVVQFTMRANPQTVRDLIADLRAERERWRTLREWLAPETEAAPPGSEAPQDDQSRFARRLLDEVLARMDGLEAGQ